MTNIAADLHDACLLLHTAEDAEESPHAAGLEAEQVDIARVVDAQALQTEGIRLEGVESIIDRDGILKAGLFEDVEVALGIISMGKCQGVYLKAVFFLQIPLGTRYFFPGLLVFATGQEWMELRMSLG